MSSSPSEELVEHVDADGNVLGIVTRAEMRRANLRHRCTYVVVTTTDDQVVVHQRAEWKDVSPQFWDVAFGGVCDVGEDWLPSAERELAEEAGLTGIALRDLGPVTFQDEMGGIIGRIYHAVSDEEPSCPDGEVVAVDKIPIADLAAWAQGRDICADTLELILPMLLSGALNKP